MAGIREVLPWGIPSQSVRPEQALAFPVVEMGETANLAVEETLAYCGRSRGVGPSYRASWALGYGESHSDLEAFRPWQILEAAFRAEVQLGPLGMTAGGDEG